jgi:L-aspartate oxidase
MDKKTDFLVIGSGIAGLSCANALAPHGKVLVVTKNAIRESATQYAQGGIAAALQKDDTPHFHFQDTIKAGDGLCQPEAVKILVEEGPARVQELIQMGASFDKEDGAFHFTKEGAHSKRRILHAGDATGKEIEKTLGNALLRHTNVTFMPNTFVTQLIKKDGEIIGCEAVHNHTLITITARATVLTTGGCGQVYQNNTNPPVATGDGLALALNVGCDLQDMEFIQFHPTTLCQSDKKPLSIFLITEAVRGEGAYLRNADSQRFMLNYHPDAELAPRDIVARAIFNESQRQNTSHVYLDLTHLKLNIAKRFPTIYKHCLDNGIDITKDLIPVAPAAHYAMGGIKTDLWGQTQVKRLYAGGEVACVGVHGANRLASNSLLDGLVFGNRIATHILNSHYTMPMDATAPHKDYQSVEPQKKQSILEVKDIIRDIMWSDVGIIRSKDTLTHALTELQKLTWIKIVSTTDAQIIEVQNILDVALQITQSALNRKESRGSHFRSDYPTKDLTLDQPTVAL